MKNFTLFAAVYENTFAEFSEKAAEYNVHVKPDKIFGILSELDIIQDRKLSRKKVRKNEEKKKFFC